MKKVLVFLAALLVMALGASAVSAGPPIPNVQVYWTSDYGTYGQTALPSCPPDLPMTVLDSLYVVASNFNMWMSAIEYYVSFPGAIVPLADVIPNGGLAIGNSWTAPGIAIAWPLPQNAFVPFAVSKIKFIYNCQDCSCGNSAIFVLAHQTSGLLRAIRWPDSAEVLGAGMISLICPTIPVEETTWGGIKALYNN